MKTDTLPSRQTTSEPSDPTAQASPPNGSKRAENASRDRIQVSLLDSHPAIREALESVIGRQMDMEVCCSSDSVEEALFADETFAPDVLILELALSGAWGLEIIQRMQDDYPDTKSVVYSFLDETIHAEPALEVGASGYIMKTTGPEKVIEAIRSAYRGRNYLSNEMTSRLLNSLNSNLHGTRAQSIRSLTDRESQVFEMLGEGKSIQEIANRLDLDVKTIEHYRRQAKEKLGLSSTNELLQYALHWTYGGTSNKLLSQKHEAAA